MSDPIKVLYVHGYLGSGNGHSSNLIRREFQSQGISVRLDAPQFSVTEPEKMHATLLKLIEENDYDYVVASSLGAFYVMQIPGIKKNLVNIALPDNLRRIKALDPENNSNLTPAFLDSIEREKEHFFLETFDDSFKQETFVLYGNWDDIAHNEDFLSHYYDDESRIHHLDMGHKLDEIGARKVVDIIKNQAEQEK